jgi:hypothetical protein
LRRPEDGFGFDEYEGERFALYVHREIATRESRPASIRFHFGAYGWCEVRFVEQDGST